jgi:hypothetical protein
MGHEDINKIEWKGLEKIVKVRTEFRNNIDLDNLFEWVETKEDYGKKIKSPTTAPIYQTTEFHFAPSLKQPSREIPHIHAFVEQGLEHKNDMLTRMDMALLGEEGRPGFQDRWQHIQQQTIADMRKKPWHHDPEQIMERLPLCSFQDAAIIAKAIEKLELDKRSADYLLQDVDYWSLDNFVEEMRELADAMPVLDNEPLEKDEEVLSDDEHMEMFIKAAAKTHSPCGTCFYKYANKEICTEYCKKAAQYADSRHDKRWKRVQDESVALTKDMEEIQDKQDQTEEEALMDWLELEEYPTTADGFTSLLLCKVSDSLRHEFLSMIKEASLEIIKTLQSYMFDRQFVNPYYVFGKRKSTYVPATFGHFTPNQQKQFWEAVKSRKAVIYKNNLAKASNPVKKTISWIKEANNTSTSLIKAYAMSHVNGNDFNLYGKHIEFKRPKRKIDRWLVIETMRQKIGQSKSRYALE